jgi:hypothetical protein
MHLRVFIFMYQAALRIYELTSASHLSLHRVVRCGRHEQYVDPNAHGSFNPVPFLLTQEDLGGAPEHNAHAVKDEALDHDLEAEGREEPKDRPLAAGIAG